MSTPRIAATAFFTPVTDALRYLPEGPRRLVNHPEGPGLLGWVAIQHGKDVPRGSMNVLKLATRENRSFPVPGRAGFFAETAKPGVVLVGTDRRFVYCNLMTGAIEETGITVTDDPRVVINDGLAVEGGVLFGTKDLGFSKPIGALYFLDSATRQVRELKGGQICSNGKVFTRDAAGITVVDIDSKPKAITKYRFDPALGRIVESEPLVAPETLPGYPDGLRPAPDDASVVVAIYNPGQCADGLARQIRIADGATLGEWEIPGSPRVTCPEFIELDGKVKLLVTTAVEGMDAATRAIAPGAGTLYVADAPQFAKLPPAPPLLPAP